MGCKRFQVKNRLRARLLSNAHYTLTSGHLIASALGAGVLEPFLTLQPLMKLLAIPYNFASAFFSTSFAEPTISFSIAFNASVWLPFCDD